MRWLISLVLAGLGVSMLAAVAALYWWVPRFKAGVLAKGREATEIQVLLITLSDITVRDFYVVIPAALLICFGLCRAAFAFAPENESSQTES